MSIVSNVTEQAYLGLCTTDTEITKGTCNAEYRIVGLFVSKASDGIKPIIVKVFVSLRLLKVHTMSKIGYIKILT